MKARHVVIGAAAVAGALAGLFWWRRRSATPAATPVQIGLTDGSVHVVEAGDPALGELETLAAGAGAALMGER